MQLSFHFIRHGETDWNNSGLIQGQIDTHLNNLGEAQASEMAEALKRHPINRIYSSPLRRAMQTAERVAACKGLHIIPVDGLRECSWGEFEGQPKGDWFEQWAAGELTPPRGEPISCFYSRVGDAMTSLSESLDGSLLVGHKCVFWAIQKWLKLDMIVEAEQGTVYYLKRYGDNHKSSVKAL